MAKSAFISKTAQKNNRAMKGATTYFLGGCGAEAFLLLIQKFYVNGTAQQVVAWDGYMVPIAIAGLVLAVLGGVGYGALRKAGGVKACASLWVLCAGLFVAITAGLVKVFYTTALTPLSVIIPVVMLLGILWHLYERECALAITVLGVSMLALWIGRRGLTHLTLGTLTLVALVLCIVAVAGVAYMVSKAVKGECKYQLVGKKSDVRGVYLACGCSAVALATALVSVSVAYYALWALAAVTFLLGVYYTVKQL